MKGKKEGYFNGFLGLFSKKREAMEDRLYEQCCSEKDNAEMGAEEHLVVFAHKFGISKEEIRHSEFLENKVLQNILSQCKSIPTDIDINSHASWITYTVSTHFDPSLTINYPTLTLEQRKEMVDAYNEKYGPIVMLAEDFYKEGYNSSACDGIMFNKARFCKLVLPDLVSQPENDEQCTSKRQKCG